VSRQSRGPMMLISFAARERYVISRDWFRNDLDLA
jgi:hypothetical protein